ncbi:unnamed protein product [Mucor circinelloides]
MPNQRELEKEIQVLFFKTVEHRKQAHDDSASEFIKLSQERQEVRVSAKVAINTDKKKPPIALGDLVMKYNDAVVLKWYLVYLPHKTKLKDISNIKPYNGFHNQKKERIHVTN